MFNMKAILALFIGIIIFSSNANAQLTPCDGGEASGYPCDDYDLVSQLTIQDLQGVAVGSDIWGWVNPDTGVEFAIMGLDNGTAFVSLCDPENPLLIGHLPTHTSNILWRDIKVYQNHAYIVSEAPGHGMQIFDLMQLPSAIASPLALQETGHYDLFGSAHNIIVNESTGYVYPVGSDAYNGGPVFLNVQDPPNPILEGGYDQDGYTHDAQILIYDGPDAEHVGKEICLASNENTLTIIDFTDKNDPVQISRTGYDDVNYTHQGWLTEDHRYYLMNDEQDEIFGEQDLTRTIIWDCVDLDAPAVIGEYFAADGSIDHNLYIRENKAYLANYNSGLRVLDLSDIENANLTEIGYFDVHPPDNGVGFDGSWSVYPYFESDLIVVSSIDLGLFVIKKSDTPLPDSNCPTSSTSEEEYAQIKIFPNPSKNQFQIQSIQSRITEFTITDALGRIKQSSRIDNQFSFIVDSQSLAPGTYYLVLMTEKGIGREKIIVE